MAMPVATEPVKPIRLMAGWRALASPAGMPRPVTMFTVPRGSRSRQISARMPAESGLCSGGFSLTLADLGGVGEGILHALPDMPRNFDTISVRPGHESNLMRPYFAAYCGDGVAEGEDFFRIPGGR